MADPRNPERASGDTTDTPQAPNARAGTDMPDPARTADMSSVPGEEHTHVRSERVTAGPRDDVERARGNRGNLRGALDEMNREAGGVGGGLANLAGGRMLPLLILVVAVIVLLVLLAWIL